MIKGGRIVKNSFRMIAKTLFGLENILAKELTDIGAENVKVLNRSVEFTGNLRMLYKSNILCRTATRVLKPIDMFKTKNEDDLYKNVRKIEWDKHFNQEQTIAIDTVITSSPFDNSLYVSQKTKDAIADYFRDKTGQRPSVDLKKPDIRLSVYIKGIDCTIALDSSGEPLFKRGYREKSGRAPLNEVLAAGIILQTNWDKKCDLVDVMCGSGTFVIEAALIAKNIAPGLIRKKYAFMNWPGYDNNLYSSVIKDAQDSILDNPEINIVGTDNNPAQIKEAISNAKRAGINDIVTFKKRDMANLDPFPPPGVLVINPPYGERMPVNDINEFYHSIGDTLKKVFTDYDAYVITGNLTAAKHIGLRTSQKTKLYNGPTECRLLKFEMYQGTRKKK